MKFQAYKLIYVVMTCMLTVVIWEILKHGYEDYTNIMELVLLCIGSVLWYVGVKEVSSWTTSEELWEGHDELDRAHAEHHYNQQ